MIPNGCPLTTLRLVLLALSWWGLACPVLGSSSASCSLVLTLPTALALSSSSLAGEGAALAAESQLEQEADEQPAKPQVGQQAEQQTPSMPSTPWQVTTPQDLTNYRLPSATLLDTVLGTTSKSLPFDWRRKAFALGLSAGPMVEWNSFRTTHLGLFVRTPLLATVMGELAANYTLVQPTTNSQLLSYTPFRQLGRPSRVEVDARLHYPIAEGIVTPFVTALPALTMVLSVTGAVRYLYYPGSARGMPFLKTAQTLLSPQLSEQELQHLSAQRLPAMILHRERYNFLLGATLDIFGPLGLMLSPQMLVGLPLMDDKLGYPIEWHLAIGIMR